MLFLANAMPVVLRLGVRLYISYILLSRLQSIEKSKYIFISDLIDNLTATSGESFNLLLVLEVRVLDLL